MRTSEREKSFWRNVSWEYEFLSFNTPKWMRATDARRIKAHYKKLFDKNGGTCEICGKAKRTMYRDHNHKTLEPRGLLCASCNSKLPIVELRLEEALYYLEKYKEGWWK